MSNLPPLLDAGRRGALGALLALGMAQAVLAAAGALGVRWLFDTLGADPQASSATLPAALMGVAVVLALAQLALRSATGRWAESLGQRYVAQVRTVLLAHLFDESVRQHQHHRHGHLMTRLTGDLGALRRWVGRCLAPLLVGSASLALAAGVLLWMQPGFAVVMLAGVAAAAGLAWAVSARLEVALRLERTQRWALAGQVGEKLGVAAVVQATGQAQRELGRLRRRQVRLHDAAVRRARWSALLQALPTALATLLMGLATAWGAMQVAGGQWSLGSLAGLLTLLGITMAPLRDLALGLGGWRSWRVSREKLTSFLSRPTRNPASRTELLQAPLGQLTLIEVSVDGALEAMNLDLARGQSLAVHGPSGSGKSVLLSLCAGLSDPTAGEVRIDGQVVHACRPESVARRVALVSADLPLLRGSIESNLRYTCRKATTEQLQAVLQRVGLLDAVSALPLGLRSRVDEGGRNLPAVMRQRLCLARALMSAPALLLIDDFDTLLQDAASGEGDPALEALLSKGPQTLIIVTAQSAWQRRCNRSLRLLNGVQDPAPRLVACAPATQTLAA